MATHLSFTVATTPSSSLKKGWIPSSLGGKAATTAPATNRRRATTPLSVVCSVGKGDSPKVKFPEEPKAAPASTFLGRSSFPPVFTFGVASSAYQIEGAWNEDGKGPSVWDAFTHEQPHKITDGSNGDVAIKSYYHYDEDIDCIKNLGVDSYRFSIAWSRILPDGTTKVVNQKGIDYYNRLIDSLIENGITPCVTLFHWDVPQNLEAKYGGFRGREIADYFAEYARICFREFGDRVKQWITLNEPWSYCTMGHCLGEHAPGRCTPGLHGLKPCPVGDSTTEPYIVAHNLIRAHGKAVKIYRDEFQKLQKGKIGITNVSMWYEPVTKSPADNDASRRLIEFMFGWFMDPLSTGDYPFSMRVAVRGRLPTFTDEEKNMIRGSYDFIGLNYYSSRYVSPIPFYDGVPPFSILDSFVNQFENDEAGNPIGDLHGSWIYVYPAGLKKILHYIKDRYNDPEIFITENGTVDEELKRMVSDQNRIDYLSVHLAELLQAIREGANVKGYFQWSFVDNFEWQKGYTEKFGLHSVNIENIDKDPKRYPKESAIFYKNFLKS